MSVPEPASSAFERAAAALDATRYELVLYVSGASGHSARAIANARALCDTHLAGRCDLSVVDVHEDPTSARADDILAVPTLVRQRPLPVRRLVGDLSRTESVLRALGLAAPDGAPPR